jgi:protein dithiol oxidoreductase (disulfide-forming)
MDLGRRRWMLLAAAVAASPRPALAVDLLEDADYRVIPQQRLADPKRIEVIEFFYYGCRWCNEFQPYLEGWLKQKPADVDFRYQPAIRNTRWLVLTKAFFALQALGELPRLHSRMYRAYHRDEVNLEDEAVLTGWLLKQGIELKPFELLMRSDEVLAKVQAAREATYSYEVDSTPSVVVDGRYLTSSGIAGGVVQLMKVVEDLIIHARQERRILKP